MKYVCTVTETFIEETIHTGEIICAGYTMDRNFVYRIYQ